MRRLVRRFQKNLRASILMAFSLLLFVSFILVGVAFNITLNQYIRASAARTLSEARVSYNAFGTVRFESPYIITGLFQQNLGYFRINSSYEILHLPILSQSALDLHELIIGRDISSLNETRVRGHHQTFFVSSILSNDDEFTVFYVNVTALGRFAGDVNMRILWLVLVIWLITMIVTTFLANSFARPLKILSEYARQIGSGDFSPNKIGFTNEEFEELNQSLNHTAKQLAKFDNEQKIFFQNASHELRTPLMSIKSYAEGIKHNIMDPKEAIHIIIEATDRLTGIVDDILYVSRIDNISMPNMEVINLQKLIIERMDIAKPIAETKHIIINFQTDSNPIFMYGVLKYIARVIDNLIANSIRYAKQQIDIECFAIGTKATIRVLDDGPGFEPEALPKIFERFYKGTEGLTGIGLSIVKSIVEQHKGIANAENGPNGAILTITLPRRM